jgi:hypothetical protein
MLNRQEAIEKHARFMSIMDEQLSWLKEQASMYAVELKYNAQDFDDVEYLIDKMSEDVPAKDIQTLYVVIGRYLGEDFRRNYGGKWEVCLEEKSPYYGFPVIADFSNVKGYVFPPIFTVKAYTIRKKKGVIKNAVNSYINPKILDLSGIPTEKNE